MTNTTNTAVIDRNTTNALIDRAASLDYYVEHAQARYSGQTWHGRICAFQQTLTGEYKWEAEALWDTRIAHMHETATRYRVGSRHHLAILRGLAAIADHSNDPVLLDKLKYIQRV